MEEKKLKTLISSSFTLSFENDKHILLINQEPAFELKKSRSKASLVVRDEEYIIHKEGFFNPLLIIERQGKVYAVIKKIKHNKESRIEFLNPPVVLKMGWNSKQNTAFFYNNNNAEFLRFSLENKIKVKTLLRFLECAVNETQFLMLFVIVMVIVKLPVTNPQGILIDLNELI